MCESMLCSHAQLIRWLDDIAVSVPLPLPLPHSISQVSNASALIRGTSDQQRVVTRWPPSNCLAGFVRALPCTHAPCIHVYIRMCTCILLSPTLKVLAIPVCCTPPSRSARLSPQRKRCGRCSGGSIATLTVISKSLWTLRVRLALARPPSPHQRPSPHSANKHQKCSLYRLSVP